jgi:demethylmenaquinone methyltransferase / 2-methoxy-6-polyprenyl-1,4-benzoquinol methylase
LKNKMTNTTAQNQRSEIGNQKSVLGAAPEGARDRESAAAAVREMFSTIAPRYDLANHVLSMNVDRLWWRRAARTFRHILQRPDARALDLCCGTGDMAFALLKQSGWERLPSAGPARIYGVDFSHAMLVRAGQKSAGKPLAWFEADALRLPLPDAHFDLVTSAFGFRNLADYDAGLHEIARVLRLGGEVGILDFGEPKGIIGALYHFYFRHVLPKVGTMISGVRGPYAYLPASVARFPLPAEMMDRMRAAGFSDVTWTPYTFGIAGLYRGTKN